MADTTLAASRPILRLPAQTTSRPASPVTEYARAFMLRRARERAERNAARRATRRAELRAKAFELIAADRIGGTR